MYVAFSGHALAKETQPNHWTGKEAFGKEALGLADDGKGAVAASTSTGGTRSFERPRFDRSIIGPAWYHLIGPARVRTQHPALVPALQR